MSDAKDEDDVPIVMLRELRRIDAEVEGLKAKVGRLRAERDALKADLARAESFAVSHEAWESCMVSHNPAWEPGGMAEFPRLVQPLWDAALGLQGRRNRVLEGARQAGRVGSAGDLEHAWEAVRGLAGLGPDSKADPATLVPSGSGGEGEDQTP